MPYPNAVGEIDTGRDWDWPDLDVVVVNHHEADSKVSVFKGQVGTRCIVVV